MTRLICAISSLEKRVASGIQKCLSAVTRTSKESMKNTLLVRWQHFSHEERVKIHQTFILECAAIRTDIMATTATQSGIVTSYHKV